MAGVAIVATRAQMGSVGVGGPTAIVTVTQPADGAQSQRPSGGYNVSYCHYTFLRALSERPHLLLNRVNATRRIHEHRTMSMHSFLQHKSLVVDDPIKRNLALCLAARFTWRCHVLSEDTVWCMWQRNNGHPSIDIGAIIVGLYRERVLYRNRRVNEPIELQHRREQRCARRVCVAITLCRVGRFDCHHTICSTPVCDD
jgi:hypothetical protein